MAKTTFWNDENTAQISEAYSENPSSATVEALSASLGVSVRSVRGKLVALGIYQKAAKPVGKRNGVKKDQIVTQIADLCLDSGEDPDLFDSLSKANMFVLGKILSTIRDLKAFTED